MQDNSRVYITYLQISVLNWVLLLLAKMKFNYQIRTFVVYTAWIKKKSRLQKNLANINKQ